MGKYIIRNNGEKIGLINTCTGNLRMLSMASAIGLSLLLSGCGNNEENIVPPIAEDIVTPIDQDVTYNIPYQVVKGDTLNKIVARYVKDAAKRSAYVDEIVKLNPSIKDRNTIITGQVIILPKVPSDALEQFGYTIKEEYISASDEINYRMDYIMNTWLSLEETKANRQSINELKKDITKAMEDYLNYQLEMNATHYSLKEDKVLAEYREICANLEELTGVEYIQEPYNIEPIKPMTKVLEP